MCKTNFFFDCRIDIIEEYANEDLKKMSLTFWNLNHKDFVKYIFLKKVKKIIKKTKKNVIVKNAITLFVIQIYVNFIQF